MRTVVGLVEARPETIADDFRRLLVLAELPVPPAAAEVQVMVVGGGGEFEPGWSATPWALASVLGCLGTRPRPCRVLGVGRSGAEALGPGAGWHDGLSRNSALAMDADGLRLRRHRTGVSHPALDSVLTAGVALPKGLAGAANFLLAAPTLRRGWGVAGAAAGLRDLVTAGARLGRRAPRAEVTAEAVAVARDLIPGLGCVLDGTLWGMEGGRCVARNVLLAGADPIAVDTVAMRLAGIETRRVPWLRICHEREAGVALLDQIRINGRRDLLDLDFELPGGTFAAGEEQADWPGPRIGSWWARRIGSRAPTGLAGSGWEELSLHYHGADAGRRPASGQA